MAEIKTPTGRAPRVGDMVLVEGNHLREAKVLLIVSGYDELAVDKEKTYYKVRNRGLFHFSRWVSQYHIKGIVRE